MHLRSRRSTSGSLQKKARRRSSAQHDQGIASQLPTEILYLLGERLGLQDVAAACVCKHWAQHLRAGITSATLCVSATSSEDADDYRTHPLVSLAKNSPSFSELQLLLSGRSGFDAVEEVMSELHTLPALKTLRLRFIVSQTPKKGMWPLFFSEAMDAGELHCMVVEGSSMPALAVENMLATLAGSMHLKSLRLLMGQPLPGSQLPAYRPPVWLQMPNYCNGPSALSKDQLDNLCKLTSLEELIFEPDTSVPASSFRSLSKLKALTSLVVNGTVSDAAAQKLGQLRKLRRLRVDIRLRAADGSVGLDALEDLQQLDLGLTAGTHLPYSMQQVNTQLVNLSARLQHCLRGLSLTGFCWSKSTVDHLAVITGLTSLQLLQVKPGLDAGSNQVDLTPLGKLQQVHNFALEFSEAPILVRFGVHWEQDSRRHSSGSQASSRRGKKQKQAPSAKDMSGLSKVWPQLQSLQLSHIAPSAVCDTCWDFRQLSGLTRLCLQFTPTADAVAAAAAMGASGPDSPSFLEAVTVKLHMDQMPQQLKQLQVTGCSLLVPYWSPFSDSLTSLSLSHCWLQRSWCLQLQGCCLPTSAIATTPVAAAAASVTPSASPVVTSPSSSGCTFNSSHLQHPLVVMLRHLPALQQLELSGMQHTQLNDSLLAAATASGPDLTAHGPSLRALTSLSVLGVGNQSLTHGGLLGLTSLEKLRVLRWHVGDALELMPDMGALGKLRGLVALHIPTWLHAQMDRWGAYAVLDSLPFCDVHVESTA